jgi:gamma-glutamyltranspeptidase
MENQMVATQICIGTVDMYDSGIGGGGFVLVRSKEGAYEFIDFRETAPAAAYEKMFTEETIKLSLRGGLGEACSHSEIIIYVTVRETRTILRKQW